MKTLLKIDDFLIDKVFQRILDYLKFKIGMTKFTFNQLFLFTIFFCDCKLYYNSDFLSFVLFLIWIALESIQNFIDAYSGLNFYSLVVRSLHFDYRNIILFIYAFDIIARLLLDHNMLIIFFDACVLIVNYAMYCSNEPKYKFKKKEKKVEKPNTVFAT